MLEVKGRRKKFVFARSENRNLSSNDFTVQGGSAPSTADKTDLIHFVEEKYSVFNEVYNQLVLSNSWWYVISLGGICVFISFHGFMLTECISHSLTLGLVMWLALGHGLLANMMLIEASKVHSLAKLLSFCSGQTVNLKAASSLPGSEVRWRYWL